MELVWENKEELTGYIQRKKAERTSQAERKYVRVRAWQAGELPGFSLTGGGARVQGRGACWEM